MEVKQLETEGQIQPHLDLKTFTLLNYILKCEEKEEN